MLPAPWLLALALVVGLLVLIPSRRLQAAGLRPRTIGLYAVGLWTLAMALAIRPGATRFLIPILLIAYLAPFVAGPEQVQRVLARGRVGPGAKPPMKDVTPREGERSGRTAGDDPPTEPL
jgi:hypothetical protein